MLSFLVYIGASKFLALDIGSAFTKGYVFEDMKQPEIAFNIVGRRLTPTYIGFRADKQFNLSGLIPITHREGYLLTAAIGDKALQYIRHRPWSATGHLPNFIDMTTEKQEEIAKRFHVNTSAARIPVEMLYPMFIQLMARELRPDEQVDGISVSVPAHFSVMQRQIIRNAIMSTGIYCDVICDEATAVATAFATSYPKSFVNERINVLFIDIGASSSKAYIYSFFMKSDTAPPEITRKSYAYDDKIGGDDITISLAKHIMQTHNINDVDNSNFYRILDVAEKIKVKLSLSQKVEESFETKDGTEYKITMTRKEFNNICKPLRDSVLEVVRQASRSIYPNRVEIIGGSSRIPYISDSIMEAVHLLNHSLNSDEVIAYGISLVTQQQLDRSLYRKFIYTNNFSVHSVAIKNDNDLIPIAEYGNPITNQLIFEGNIRFFPLVYTKGLAEGIQHKAFVYLSHPNKTYNYTSIIFAQEPLDVYAMEGCETENGPCEEIPTSLNLKYVQNYTIQTSVMGRFESERRLLISRKAIEKLSSRALREIKFNMTVKLFSTEQERSDINQAAQHAQEFLSSSDEEIDPDFFEEKHKQLQIVTDKIYNRIKENATMSRAMNRFYKLIQGAEHFAFFEVPLNKSFIGQKNILKLQKMVNESKIYFNEVATILNNAPLNQDRTVKAKDIQNNFIELVDFIEKINNMRPYNKKENEKEKKGIFSSFVEKIRDKVAGDTDFDPDVDVIEDDEL